MNNVYEVVSTNLDCNDGSFTNVLFALKTDAFEYCRKSLLRINPTNVIEDINGELKEYDGKDLYYSPSEGLSAIYYRSHYGNYRCVYYVRERYIN
jgi:hypothetical protein